MSSAHTTTTSAALAGAAPIPLSSSALAASIAAAAIDFLRNFYSLVFCPPNSPEAPHYCSPNVQLKLLPLPKRDKKELIGATAL